MDYYAAADSVYVCVEGEGVTPIHWTTTQSGWCSKRNNSKNNNAWKVGGVKNKKTKKPPQKQSVIIKI